jgi:two-component system, NarL family, invasion response regulator UvrY
MSGISDQPLARYQRGPKRFLTPARKDTNGRKILLRNKSISHQQSLNEQLCIEKLLVELSTTFIDLPTTQNDRQIEIWLRRFVESPGIDWSTMVLDLCPGDRSGLEALKEVKRIRPRLPVLILSMHSEEQSAHRAFNAGASGFITKDCTRSDLMGAIQKVLQGGKYVSPLLAEKLVGSLGPNPDKPPHEALSDREFEVMCLIASGKTVGEIAAILSLSDKTISTYRARILDKMRMKTNAEVTRYAIQNKIVG